MTADADHSVRLKNLTVSDSSTSAATTTSPICIQIGTSKLPHQMPGSRICRAWSGIVAQNPALVPDAAQAQRLLEAYLLEKALYELLYELNNRPAWAELPLRGLLDLIERG